MTLKHIMNDIKQSSSMVKNTTVQQSTGKHNCPDCIDGYKLFEHMEQLYRVPCRTCNVKSNEEVNNEDRV